eukprot:COSAG01_NODE_3239_length_6369_cov_4.207018_7_plen_52_part_00
MSWGGASVTDSSDVCIPTGTFQGLAEIVKGRKTHEDPSTRSGIKKIADKYF